MMKNKKKSAGIAAAALLIIMAGLTSGCGRKAAAIAPGQEALDALTSDGNVVVNEYDDRIEFVPYSANGRGLICINDEDTDARCLALTARQLAEDGYTVVIAKTNDGTGTLQSAYQKVSTWALAGFGSGSITVCRTDSEGFSGLIFYACGPGSENSMAAATLPVLCILGELDTTDDGIAGAAAEAYLPAESEFYIIGGANHLQFVCAAEGSAYEGDGQADIAFALQQKLIIEQTEAFLSSL